jgi:DNA (cytosine-5)-methyltransferase 1
VQTNQLAALVWRFYHLLLYSQGIVPLLPLTHNIQRLERVIYYNEISPFAVEWLKRLMYYKVIPFGDIDERSIEEVKASDLKGYTACHFFAGIGVWAYTLDQAGWDQSRQVWTGSCPCQPFSSPGHKKGFKDARHLWPAWFRLIKKCRPDAIFGEQVATKNGLAWLDLVRDDLGLQDYTLGVLGTDACFFGAPHKRSRLYFTALGNAYLGRPLVVPKDTGWPAGNAGAPALADAHLQRLEGPELRGRLVNIEEQSRDRGVGRAAAAGKRPIARRRDSSTATFWDDCEWVKTWDEKAERPIEPGTFPLAYGTPTDMGEVRGYGNAICAPQAQGFIEAVMGVVRDGA